MSVEVSVAHVTKLHLVNVLDALELTINAKSSMRVYLLFWRVIRYSH